MQYSCHNFLLRTIGTYELCLKLLINILHFAFIFISVVQLFQYQRSMILPTCNMQMIMTLALAASVWDCCVVMLSMSGICNCIYSLISPQRCWFSACRDVTGEVWHADEVLSAQLLSAQLLFPRSAGDHSEEETETATEVGGCPLLAAGLRS